MNDPEHDRMPLRIGLVIIIIILMCIKTFGGTMGLDYREDGRFIKEDGEARKTKNDPHNPKNLLKRKRDTKGDGFNQSKDGWSPTAWNDSSGAGKGDAPRPNTCSGAEYGLRYDLATGRITKEEYDKAMKELNS